MASLVIAAPQSPLALLGWTNLSKVCELFTSIAPNSKPTSNSLALLNRLRRAAHLKLQGRWQFNAGNELNGHPQLVPVGVELESESDPPDTQAEEQSSILIGLHSRLVDRMNEDMAVSHIIRVPVRVSRERSTVLSPGGSSSHVSGRLLSSLSYKEAEEGVVEEVIADEVENRNATLDLTCA